MASAWNFLYWLTKHSEWSKFMAAALTKVLSSEMLYSLVCQICVHFTEDFTASITGVCWGSELINLPDYTASHPNRIPSFYSWPWNPSIWYNLNVSSSWTNYIRRQTEWRQTSLQPEPRRWVQLKGDPHPPPCRFTPGKGAPGAPWVRVWVAPRTSLNVSEVKRICCTCRNSNSRSSSP